VKAVMAKSPIIPSVSFPTASRLPAKKASKPSGIRRNSWWRLQGKEGVLFLLGIVLLWQFASSSIHFSGDYLFPSPAVTLKALWGSLPELLKDTWSSLLVLLPGYALAAVAGIVWGLVVGTIPWVSRMFSPFARFASPVPPTIYVPYAIAMLPTFRTAAGFVVFVGAFWPIFLNTAAGAASLPQRHRDNARILGLKPTEYLWRIVFPSSLPHIFSGMSVGLVFSFIMLTVAELFGASAGLGRFVQLYADYADYPRMVAGILYTGVVVMAAMELLEQIKRRSLFWMK
jgi:NitT/TauT family transport system permease protein